MRPGAPHSIVDQAHDNMENREDPAPRRIPVPTCTLQTVKAEGKGGVLGGAPYLQLLVSLSFPYLRRAKHFVVHRRARS